MFKKQTLSSEADTRAYLALWRCDRVGPVRFKKIFSQLEKPSALFSLSQQQLKNLGLSTKACEQLTQKGAHQTLMQAVDNDLNWTTAEQHSIVNLTEPSYPNQLSVYPDAPPLLFIKGNPNALHLPQLAIVGTRNPSTYGKENARNFARDLTSSGLTITSGLALGIDGHAHQGALDMQGPTLAILAHGLDQIYPKTHTHLATRILEQEGALVSEFPLGVEPRRQYFPRRNRIMSALAYGVLVVEAALKSGSLITARLALQQGKEVFAIPGSISNPLTKGCHQLIREGATLVENVQEITAVLAPLMKQELRVNIKPTSHHLESLNQEQTSQNSPVKPIETPTELSPVEREVLSALDTSTTDIDTLVNRTGLPTQQLLTQLMVLELKLLAETVPGGYQKLI